MWASPSAPPPSSATPIVSRLGAGGPFCATAMSEDTLRVKRTSAILNEQKIRTLATAFKWTNAIHGDLRFLQSLVRLRIRSAPLESARRNQESRLPLEPRR